MFSGTVLIVTLSIVLHELAHGFMAILQGDSTPNDLGHMTINPVVHMGWSGIIFLLLFGISWGQMPINPARFRNPKLGGILVALAGPLTNLILGAIFLILAFSLSHGNVNSQVVHVQDNLLDILYLGALLNLILCIFNLMPVPPLDGFKVVQEIFPFLRRLGENPGVVFILFVILYNIPGFWSWMYGLAGKIIRGAMFQLNLLFPL